MAAIEPPTRRVRARDLGIVIGHGRPGPLNAITDVAGVRVGHTTLIRGDGPLVVGQGPVRTGVTVVVPHGGDPWTEPVFAGCHRLNGNGELTGLEWIREAGQLSGIVGLTNTHSVGVVHDELIAEGVRANPGGAWSLPVVGETWDGRLNDVNGFHVRAEHVRAAIESAAAGAVPEGAVGGGTGMICHEFKGGIGTASRVLDRDDGGWTVGVLVQANYGRRSWLRVDGVPVGEAIPTAEVPSPNDAARVADERRARAVCGPDRDPERKDFLARGGPDGGRPAGQDHGRDGRRDGGRPASQEPGPQVADQGARHAWIGREAGSIIVLVATDAPLLPHQCARLAQRAGLGLARAGGTGGNYSGDLFLAWATGNRGLPAPSERIGGSATVDVRMVPDRAIDPLFDGVIEATEEAIVNALVAAETMTGRDGVTAHALPHDRLREVMGGHGRGPRSV